LKNSKERTPGPSSPGRAILSYDAVFSVDALCKCVKS
jgi:hypothetical protein